MLPKRHVFAQVAPPHCVEQERQRVGENHVQGHDLMSRADVRRLTHGSAHDTKPQAGACAQAAARSRSP